MKIMQIEYLNVLIYCKNVIYLQISRLQGYPKTPITNCYFLVLLFSNLYVLALAASVAKLPVVASV